MRMPLGSSPHTRGARVLDGLPFEQVGIIPAYAGSTSGRPSGSCTRLDHPRIRGEHVSIRGVEALLPGSSPHTRGARCPQCRGSGPGRIIPAYAGSTDRPLGRPRPGTDHPRIRGEHHLEVVVDPVQLGIIPAYAGSTARVDPQGELTEGSSPHTRGAPPEDIRTPARAPDHPRIRGEHLLTVSCRSPREDHPRIRGEHYLPKEADIFEGGSSPHTRGARLTRYLPKEADRIIPAYAGSTRHSFCHRRPAWDHPRIRGEHRS